MKTWLLLLGLCAGPSAPTQDTRTPRAYDIGGLETEAWRPGHPRGQEPSAPAPQGYDDLLAVLREHLRPPLEDPERDLHVSGAMLFALLTPEQHAWVQAFLERQRAQTEPVLDMRAYVLTLPREMCAELGFTTPSGSLEPGALEPLLERVKTDSRPVELLQAPRVLWTPWKRCSISAGESLDYVGDWQVHEHVEPGDQRLVVPVVQQLFDGLEIGVLAAVVEGQTIDLDFHLVQTRVQRPLPVFRTGEGLEVCLPEWTTRAIETRAVLEAGQALWFRSTEVDPEAPVIVALVRVDLVPPTPR